MIKGPFYNKEIPCRYLLSINQSADLGWKGERLGARGSVGVGMNWPPLEAVIWPKHEC